MIFFWTFLIIWTFVHILFEYRFFKDRKVFAKYQTPVTSRVAAKVYYTKATWMFIFVWMQVLGASLQTAVAWSFFIYSIELLIFFPLKRYHILNGLLAVACVIENAFFFNK